MPNDNVLIVFVRRDSLEEAWVIKNYGAGFLLYLASFGSNRSDLCNIYRMRYSSAIFPQKDPLNHSYYIQMSLNTKV